MVLINIICFTVFVLFIIFYRFYKKFCYWEDLGVPFIKPEIPYGNMRDLNTNLSSSQFYARFYSDIRAMGERYGGFYDYMKPVLFVTDLDLLRNIFIKDFQSFHDREAYHNVRDDPLTGHLFNVEGDYWSKMRRKLTPSFTTGQLRNALQSMIEVGLNFKECVSKNIEGNSEMDMHKIAERFTCDVIGRYAFGIDCKTLENQNSEFLKMGLMALHKRVTWFTRAVKYVAVNYPNLSRRFGLKFTRPIVEDFFLKIVEDVVKSREQDSERSFENDSDAISFLMRIENKNDELSDGRKDRQEKLSIGQIAAQSFVAFLAGYHTSSVIISFCLRELSLNETLQDKTRKEIRDVLKRYEGNITYDGLKLMTYLDQCIKETFRKYPTTTSLVRKVTRDYQVPDSNLILKKGMTVATSPSGIHNDPEIYSNPEQFDPDRFTPENIAKRHPMAYVPFGHGPRSCIASRLGLLEIKVGLAVLLSNFKFHQPEGNKNQVLYSKNHVVLVPSGGVILKVEKL